jgi:hypothetical protein
MERAWEDMDWIHLAQDVFVNTVMKLRVSQNADNFLSISATTSFSRRIHFHGVIIRHYMKSKVFMEVVLALFTMLTRNSLGVRKTMKKDPLRLSGLSNMIRTPHFQNTTQEQYCSRVCA